MSTCATCKHWGTAWREFDLCLGRCRRIPFILNATERPAPCESLQMKAEHRETQAFAQDAEEYDAWLLTKSSFGCTMYEPRT